MCSRVDPSKLNWIRKPSMYILSSDKLVLETEPNTTFHVVDEDNTAVGLYGQERIQFEVKAKVEYDFRHEEDECGLVLKFDTVHWMKFGIKRINHETNEIFCERHNFQEIDYAKREYGTGIEQIYFRVKYRDGKLMLRYGFNPKKYWDLRTITWDEVKPITVGLYACSPKHSYFDCTFSAMELNELQKG